MDRLLDVFGRVGLDVWTTIEHNWPFLLASVVLASAIQVFVGTDRLARWLRARTWLAVVGAVALGALTPFCSCGTTAVVLGALASSVPWAPVVAFMVASPLTSPAEYVLSVGLFGTSFATTFFVAAIVIGLAAGAVTSMVERGGALVGQARVRAPQPAAVGSCDGSPHRGSDALTAGVDLPPERHGRPGLVVLEPVPASCCSTTDVDRAASCAESSGSTAPTSRLGEFARALALNGRRLVVFFLGFAALGYLLIELIPTQVLTTYLGADSLWSVPVAATLGIPIYLNTDASLPLVASFMAGGMGPGAALAFLITGAGTSVGAISGMLLIARWKVVALVIASLWVGALVLGYLAPLWL
ncbi:permease [Pengzhenrongella frigida]|nr:permease [Cellulomonas sp. HLT2-17]